MRRSGAINCPMSNACICRYSPSVRVIQLPVETPFHIISPNVITHAIARPVRGTTLVRIDPSIGLLHIITQRPSPFLSPQTIEPKDNSVFVSETLPSLGITRQLFDADSWTNHTSAYRGGRLSNMSRTMSRGKIGPAPSFLTGVRPFSLYRPMLRRLRRVFPTLVFAV